jgi:hypothetical protein
VSAERSAVALVGDDPLVGFALGEFHGLGDGRRAVDVILLAGLVVDALDFGLERIIFD